VWRAISTPVQLGFRDFRVEVVTAGYEITVSRDQRGVSRRDDSVSPAAISLDLELIRVFLFAVVLNRDSPIRKRSVYTGNEDAVAIKDVELRHHLRTALIS
jgi:hypothetical protein